MANEGGSTPTNRSPTFWVMIAAGAVVLALVISMMSYGVVDNEPAGAARDRTTQGQQTDPQPNEAERSTGSVSPQPARPAGPVEPPATTTQGTSGTGGSIR